MASSVSDNPYGVIEDSPASEEDSSQKTKDSDVMFEIDMSESKEQFTMNANLIVNLTLLGD